MVLLPRTSGCWLLALGGGGGRSSGDGVLPIVRPKRSRAAAAALVAPGSSCCSCSGCRAPWCCWNGGGDRRNQSPARFLRERQTRPVERKAQKLPREAETIGGVSPTPKYVLFYHVPTQTIRSCTSPHLSNACTNCCQHPNVNGPPANTRSGTLMLLKPRPALSPAVTAGTEAGVDSGEAPAGLTKHSLPPEHTSLAVDAPGFTCCCRPPPRRQGKRRHEVSNEIRTILLGSSF